MRNPVMVNPLLDQEDPDSHEVQPGAWRDVGISLYSLDPSTRNNVTIAAKNLRNYLRDYYNNTSPMGNVPWQDSMFRKVRTITHVT